MQIGGNGLQILWWQLRKTFLDHRCHRPCSHTVVSGVAGLHKGQQILLAPGPRQLRISGQGRSGPAFCDTAAQVFAAPLLPKQEVSWRMTGAAMAQPLRQIGPPVPLFTLAGVWLHGTGRQIEPVPGHDPLTDIEREMQ
ncbi:hypothetical protein D3C80_1464650 [compost metagenome]